MPLLIILYVYPAFGILPNSNIFKLLQRHKAHTINHIDLNNLSFFFSSVRLLEVSIKVNIIKPNEKKWQINLNRIKIGTLKLKISDKWIPLKNIDANGVLEFYKNGKTRVYLKVNIPDSGQIQIDAKRVLEQTDFTITSQNIDIFPFIHELIPGKILTKGKIPGLLNIKGTINETTKRAKLDLKIKIKGASWEDELFEYAGDGAEATLAFSGVVNGLNAPKLLGRGTLEIPEGNVLINGTVIDFKNNPLRSKFALNANPQKGRIEFNPANIQIGRNISITINGNFLKNLNIYLHVKSLKELEELILPDFEEKYSLSGYLDVNGTATNAISNNKSIEGRIKTGINLSSNDSLNFTILADLPFSFAFGGNNSLSQKQHTSGYIKIPVIKFGNLSTKNILFKIVSIENGWKLTNRAKASFMKGTIIAEKGLLKLFPNIFGHMNISTPKCFKYNLEAEYLSSPVPLKICLPSLKVTLQKKDLRLRGNIKVNMFSGKLIINHLKVENIFSQSRSIIMDAQWKDIDLKQLSSVTSFGLITGKLKGYVKNLRIAYGAPVAFDLVIESQPEKKQVISVAAIENITQIGSATSPFQTIVGKAMTTFFKSFSYDKIGIRCILKNDFFSLEGLIKEGNTEYLIRKRGIKGVNVINKQSPNLISWREMINRLKRIKRVESTEGGEKTNAKEK